MLSSQARELAEDYGVKIFTADIIYHLFDQFTAYVKQIRSAEQEAARFRVSVKGGARAECACLGYRCIRQVHPSPLWARKAIASSIITRFLSFNQSLVFSNVHHRCHA